MNNNILLLHQKAQKQTKRIIGLMSGTSLDGLDIAVCLITNSGFNTKIVLENFETVVYDDEFKNEIKQVFSRKNVELQKLCLLNEWIGVQHAEMINSSLKKWNYNKEDIDFIASHGQTIYHAPKTLHKQLKFGNATLQIGDGDHVAVKTGIITLSDFRQKHVAAGGEGAPLAAYGDFLIFRKEGENRIMLNMGGIANFTFLPGDNKSQIFSTDVGTGNTLMDAYVQKHFTPLYFDDNATIASQGVINESLLEQLKQNSFFDQPMPKTTAELFNLNYLVNAQILSNTTKISHYDVMATLNRFSADTIVKALEDCEAVKKNFKIFMSGGGMHNPLLITNMKKQLPNNMFLTTDSLEINPDAKEGVLFAILANEAIYGGKDSLGNIGFEIPNVSMGKISFPK